MRYVATPMHRADGTFTHRAFDDAPHPAERPGRRTASIRGLGVPFIAGWAQTPDIACAAFEHALAQLPGEWTSRRWEAGGHFLCIGIAPQVTLDGVAPEDADTIELISGAPLSWDGDDAHAILDPADARRAPMPDGRWVAVRAGRYGVHVRTDALGAGAAFELESEHLRVATNLAGTLAAPALGSTLDWAAVATSIVTGTTPSGAPWVHGARRLWGGAARSYGQFATGGSPGERWRTAPSGDHVYDAGRAAHRVASATAALHASADRHAVLVPLTAGRDSRLILAATLAAGYAPQSFTVGTPDDREVRIGAALARATGLSHTTISPDAAGLRDCDPAHAARTIAHVYAGTASPGDARLVAFGPNALAGAAWLTGQGGEIARRFYGPSAGPLSGPLVGLRVASRHPRRPVPFTVTQQLRIARSIAGIVRGAHGAGDQPLGDRVYIGDRMQRHYGGSLAMFDWANPPLTPLWTMGVVEQMLALDPALRLQQRFHIDVVGRLAPQLAELDLERGDAWASGHAGATGLLPTSRSHAAATCPPALLGAQEHLADLTRRIPWGAPIWQHLSRRGVNWLAHTRAADLDPIQRQYVWRLAGALSVVA